MTAVNPDASQQGVVEAALVLLERMGLSPADLAAVPQPRKQVPTFTEYVPPSACRSSYRGGSPVKDVIGSILPLAIAVTISPASIVAEIR